MTTNITTSAQPTSGSSVRLRKRHPTAAVKPARITTHSRIEPSSADHMAATLYSAGCCRDPTCWT